MAHAVEPVPAGAAGLRSARERLLQTLWFEGLGLLLADFGLGLVYAVYGYAFHWAFDRLRPVRRAEAE